MASNRDIPVPDAQTCEQARISRDPRFDGLFVTAVTTTRIYCRSVCPVATVRNEHVRYFRSAAAAEHAGFRPCLRCRPELAPNAWRQGDAAVERALRLIDRGYLGEHSLADLAGLVGKGERQLRRLFVERLGASPHRIHTTRRLLIAKQLLTDTDLPITQVALEAGFGSLRRFNASFRAVYNRPPRQLRRGNASKGETMLALCLDYRPPYDLKPVLERFAERAIPGVEAVTDASYARTFGPPDAPGWLMVEAWPRRGHAMRLRLYCPKVGGVFDVVNRVRRMFDLDANPQVIYAALAKDAELSAAVARPCGARVPGPWDRREALVRSYLHQHYGRDACAFLATLMDPIEEPGKVGFPDGLTHRFPPTAALTEADPEVLAKAGLSTATVRALGRIGRAMHDGTIDVSAAVPLDAFVASWRRVTGAEVTEAHDIALHALGHPDALAPRETVALESPFDQLSPATFRLRSERWRPWRAYALEQLRSDAADSIRPLSPNKHCRVPGEERTG